MNLPMRLLLFAGLTMLCNIARPITNNTPAAKHPAKHLFLEMAPIPNNEANNPTSTKQTQYYWFTYPDDWYNDHKTVSQEEFELWALYGVWVDTNPGGGTLLMRGFYDSAWPHDQPPSVLLYGHF